MSSQHLLSVLNRHWPTLVTTVVAGAVAALVVSAAIPIRYRSSMELLILQRYAFARDAYTASKSIEYLASVFGQIIYSQNFTDEVLASGYNIENNLSTNPETRKKQWKKIVKTQVNRDTGTISISVLHRDPNQAQQISQAILHILNTKGDTYHGEGDRVVIKTLDEPYVATRPAQPNLPANAAVGALLAVLAAFTLLANGKEFEFTPGTIRAYFFPPKNGIEVEEPAQEPSTGYEPMPQFVFEAAQRQMATAPVNEIKGSSPFAKAQSSNKNNIPRPSVPPQRDARGGVAHQPEIGFQVKGMSTDEIKRQMRQHNPNTQN